MRKKTTLIIDCVLLVVIFIVIGIMAIRENRMKKTEPIAVEDISIDESLEQSENEQSIQDSSVFEVSDQSIEEVKTKKNEITNVTELKYPDAEAELRKIGFKNITGLFKDDSSLNLSEGIVIEQNFPAGDSVGEDEVIILTCIKAAEYYKQVFPSLNIVKAREKAEKFNLKINYHSVEIEDMNTYVEEHDDDRSRWVIESVDSVSDDGVIEVNCRYTGEGVIIDNEIVTLDTMFYEIGGLPLEEALEKLSAFPYPIKCYYSGNDLTDYESNEYYVICGSYYEPQSEIHLVVQTKYIMENANGYKDVLEHRIPAYIARDVAEKYLRELYGEISFAGYYPHEVMMDNGKYDTWRINGGCKINGEEKSYAVYVTGTEDNPVIIDHEISEYYRQALLNRKQRTEETAELFLCQPARK